MTEADTCRNFVGPAFATQKEIDEFRKVKDTEVITAQDTPGALSEPSNPPGSFSPLRPLSVMHGWSRAGT